MSLERKIPLISSFLLMMHIASFAQSTNKNYIQTKTFLDDTGLYFLRHVDYYDELGYVAESVDVGCNTTQTPIVVKTDYTSNLKVLSQWRPVPAAGLDYHDDVMYEARTTYNDSEAYTLNDYDDFQELASTRKPGIVWDDYPVTVTRNVVPSTAVRKYSVSTSGSLSDDGMYPYGVLMSTTTTDEDGRSLTVYTDMDEKTVLERRGEGNDTYFVYDDYGRLSYVLPPMCQQCSASMMPKYWYKYTYDDRGRCIEKQLPGCTAVKYWYDEANRIQSEQDGHLREHSLYRNYSYDGIGRLILQTIGTAHGDASHTNAVAVEIKNYYDDYSFRPELACLLPEWADSINAACVPSPVTKGRLTATLSYTSNGGKYFELYRYDANGRVSYRLSAFDDKWMKIVHTVYNFVGDIVSIEEGVYSRSNGTTSLLAGRRTCYTYHPSTLLLANTVVTHIDKDGNTDSQTVSNPSYDVYGNVIANNRPGTAADITYTYDLLHGWLRDISTPSGFSEHLQYETAANAQLSGHIGALQWTNTSNGELHQYDYTYDSLGRLTSSLYSSSVIGNDGRFDELVSYNPNGSIMSLQRHGMKNDGTFGLIDDLTVNYDGNRLLKVTDDAEMLNYNGALDFADGDDADCEYEYDNNGGLTFDSNRGITSITYDYGHYPRIISSSTKKRTIYNDYTPDGRKLSSSHVTYVSNGASYRRILTKDTYVDGLILRGGAPLMWLFDGGYVSLDANGAPTGWNYFVADHLGSTRMVVDSNDSIRETVSYYPFGSEMRMQSPAQLPGGFVQPYRFNGKELDHQNGLNMYDFGARWYDVAGVPMWTSVDPMAEKYYSISPYAYCGNNPVKYIDQDGKEIVIEGSYMQQLILLSSLQLLTNDNLAMKKNGEVYIESTGTRNQDMNLNVGTALVSSMIHNKHTATLSLNKKEKNFTHPLSYTGSINGKGTDVQISIDPCASTNFLVNDEKKGKSIMEQCPLHIALGHEMVHGYRDMNGIAKDYGLFSFYMYKNEDGQTYRKTNRTDELETVGIMGNFAYSENIIRKEQNVNLRIKY